MGSVNATREIRAKTVVTPQGALADAVVELEGGRIRKVRAGASPPAPETAGILIPGIIDLQTNGGFGIDFGSPEAGSLEFLSRQLAAHGCTAFLPTLISQTPKALERSLGSLAREMAAGVSGAQPLGVHLEGPFLNPEKAGTHPAESLRTPSLRLFDTFQKAARGSIRLLTLAPELPEADRLIRYCREQCTLAVGHSLAGFEEMSRAIDLGVRSATHVFNAMRPLRHRDPGLLGAILTRAEVFACLIPDGHHIHPSLVEILVRCKGTRRSIMVTDSTSAAGMPDGLFRLGTLEVVSRGGVCRNREGILAGSALLPDQGLRNLLEWLGPAGMDLGLEEIVSISSSAPAELLGLEEKGRIATGQDADLVLLDDHRQVVKTWVKGELIYCEGS